MRNRSFEDGWTDILVPGSHTKNHQPNEWTLTWVDIGDPVWGFTRPNPLTGERDPLIANGITECRVIPEDLLPPEERSDGDDPLVLDGTHTYKVFHMGAITGTQLEQTVSSLEPNRQVDVSIPIRAHLHNVWNEPDDVIVSIIINGITVNFIADQLGDREWNVIGITGTTNSSGELNVRIRFVTAWEHPRDFFIDDLSMVYAVNEGCEPRQQYNRVYNVIPDHASEEQAVQIFLDGWRESRQTAGGSYDDAGIGLLANKTAVLYGIDPAQHQLYRDWYDTHYPNTNVVFKDLPASSPFDFSVYPLLNVTKRVTQPWGARPEYYAQFGLPGHDGIDLQASDGTKVVSVAPGTVFNVHTNPDTHNYGIHVRVQHIDGYQTVYAHLSQSLVSEGDAVSAGDLIGLAGNTGNSSGTHLHLALKKQGETYTDSHGTWPYNLFDPTPYLQKFLNTPSPTSDPALGLHLRADLSELSDSGYAEVETLALANAPNIVKLLHAHPASVFTNIRNKLGDNAIYVVRVFQSWGGREVTPQQFFDWNIDELEQRLSLLPQSQVWVELHNEPNLEEEGWGHSWNNGVEFGNWITVALDLFRQRLPNVKFMYPGLSPGGDYPGVRYDSTKFLNESLTALDRFDGVGVHAYWSDPFPMTQAVHHVNLVRSKTTLPMIITEASRNDRPATRTPEEYATDYIQFLNQLKYIANVLGITIFVLSASAPVFEPEVFVLEDGTRKGIAGYIANLL